MSDAMVGFVVIHIFFTIGYDFVACSAVRLAGLVSGYGAGLRGERPGFVHFVYFCFLCFHIQVNYSLCRPTFFVGRLDQVS